MTEIQIIVKSERSNREEDARRIAWKLHEELFTIKGHYRDVYDAHFFKGYTPPEDAPASTSRQVLKSKKQDVHRRQWSFPAQDGNIFSHPESEENDPKDQQTPGD